MFRHKPNPFLELLKLWTYEIDTGFLWLFWAWGIPLAVCRQQYFQLYGGESVALRLPWMQLMNKSSSMAARMDWAWVPAQP